MYFSRWESLDNMKNLIPLNKVTLDDKSVKSSGIPMAYGDDCLYVSSRANHTLVIGRTGSGKTQVMTLPMLKLATLAGESVVVSDPAKELYDLTKDMFKENGYRIIKLNFDEYTDTDNWNPFGLIKKYYEGGNKDKAVELIEDLGFYLLYDKEEKNSDPFWINSAISYFTGICLYCLEKEKNISLKKVYEISENIKEKSKDFLDSFDKMSLIYIHLSGILLAPPETKGSIFAVFSDKIRKYISKSSLMDMLSNDGFDISSINDKKTIVYLQAGKSISSSHLIPLFVSQLFATKEDRKRINVILDDFYMLNPIKGFTKMLDFSRSMNIIFTIMISGFNDLKNAYGTDNTEIIKSCCGNIVYLLSQDFETLEEICKYCGNSNQNTPLISVEELKTLNVFDAIILTTRVMPFKTSLLPYYKIKEYEENR